jgi:iron complex transport system ATP-binding protein
MNGAAILEFEGITFGYPTRPQPVLQDFNLQIIPGSVTAILGPNGVGKTTLLHLGLSWLHPSAGRVLLDGVPLIDYKRRTLGQWISLVPQTENSAFDFTLLDYVLLGRAPYLQPLAMPGEEDYRIAEEALDAVGMKKEMFRSVLNLSGGERQLVLVARALTQQPKLLFLDEPTSHLDLSNKGRLAHLLRTLVDRGVTILFSTHEPDFAINLADQLVLIRKGQVLRQGPIDSVLTTENLTELYQMPLEVRQVDGKQVVLWN